LVTGVSLKELELEHENALLKKRLRDLELFGLAQRQSNQANPDVQPSSAPNNTNTTYVSSSHRKMSEIRPPTVNHVVSMNSSSALDSQTGDSLENQIFEEKSKSKMVTIDDISPYDEDEEEQAEDPIATIVEIRGRPTASLQEQLAIPIIPLTDSSHNTAFDSQPKQINMTGPMNLTTKVVNLSSTLSNILSATAIPQSEGSTSTSIQATIGTEQEMLLKLLESSLSNFHNLLDRLETAQKEKKRLKEEKRAMKELKREMKMLQKAQEVWGENNDAAFRNAINVEHQDPIQSRQKRVNGQNTSKGVNADVELEDVERHLEELLAYRPPDSADYMMRSVKVERDGEAVEFVKSSKFSSEEQVRHQHHHRQVVISEW
jgi:hypothetical protein